jgi:hypothetical protein
MINACFNSDMFDVYTKYIIKNTKVIYYKIVSDCNESN